MLALAADGYVLIAVPGAVIIAALTWIGYREHRARRRDNNR